jgi:hypothetical protein
MIRKLAKILAAVAVVAAMGTAFAPAPADAGPTKCWRGAGGGWYCY